MSLQHGVLGGCINHERQIFTEEEFEQARCDFMTPQIERGRCRVEAEVLAGKAESLVPQSELESCQAMLAKMRKRQMVGEMGYIFHELLEPVEEGPAE